MLYNYILRYANLIHAGLSTKRNYEITKSIATHHMNTTAQTYEIH